MRRTMNVKEMLTQYLIDNGYQGLQCDECGCGIDDLIPCNELNIECEAAYAFECSKCKKKCEHYPELYCYGTIYSTHKDYCEPDYE